MLLWTEEMHEEHFKDLLRAAEKIRIARQEKERRRKGQSQRTYAGAIIWSGPLLSSLGKQLHELIKAVQVTIRDKGPIL